MSNEAATTSKALSNQRIRLLTSTAIFAAMITVMTAYICHVPVGANGGYIHFGDSLIYIAATLLPTPYALAAAAIGGGMADLLTSPMWAPATIIIKMIITIPFTNKTEKIVNVHNCDRIPVKRNRLLYCRGNPFRNQDRLLNVIIRKLDSERWKCYCIYNFRNLP